MRILILVVALVACSSTDPQPTIYREDFDNPSAQSGWFMPLTHLDPADIPSDAIHCFPSWLGKESCEAPWRREANGVVVSHSPWWVDPNSEAPGGAGTLLLLGFVRVNGEDGGPVIGNHALSLRDATLTARLRVDSLALPDDSHIYFWFQTLDESTGLRVNFVLLGAPVDRPATNGRWYDWTATLSPDAHWQCLGSSYARSDFYGCMDVGTALDRVIYDFGFIAFPAVRPKTFPADPNSVGTGALRMDSFEIRGAH